MVRLSEGVRLLMISSVEAPIPRVMSLREPQKKMSKSTGSELSRIHLDDTPEEIRKKIRKAVTDSLPGVSYDPQTRHGLRNLLDIHCALSEESVDSVVERFSNKGTREFKEELAELLLEHLRPVQDRLHQLEEDPAYVEQVLARGRDQAREAASRKYQQVWEVVRGGRSERSDTEDKGKKQLEL